MNAADPHDDTIAATVEEILAARSMLALTGAGTSVESGIPPFRGKGGLWERFDPLEVAHIDAFQADPARVWRRFLGDAVAAMTAARPNTAHRALARLEAAGRLRAVITQNVDGLHQRAGSRDVIEFHGSFHRLECTVCRAGCEARRADLAHLPPRCGCGGLLRPACVFFGEPIPAAALARAHDLAAHCDLMLIVGTSAVVQPAALLPEIAKTAGARLIEINPDTTPLSHTIGDRRLTGPASAVLDRLVRRIERRLSAEQGVAGG